MNTARVALGRLTALPGALPAWLAPEPPSCAAGEPDPVLGLAYEAAMETTAAVGQRSLEEFLR